MQPTVERTVQKIDVFKGLTREQLIELNTWLLRKEYAQGAEIFREGQLPNGLYVLVQGVVSASKSSGYRKVKLADMEAPDFFGEMGLLNGAERSAAIVAETPVLVGLLPTDVFEAKLERNNLTALRIALNIGRLVCQRLRTMNKKVVSQTGVITKRRAVSRT